jgi:hypothetical protein
MKRQDFKKMAISLFPQQSEQIIRVFANWSTCPFFFCVSKKESKKLTGEERLA